MWTEKHRAVAIRVSAVVFALVISLLAVGALLEGRLTYRNYWGGIVFAPLGIVVAFLFLLAGFKIARPSPKVKLSRKQRQLEERARNTHFAIDDYSKPWDGGA